MFFARAGLTHAAFRAAPAGACPVSQPRSSDPPAAPRVRLVTSRV